MYKLITELKNEPSSNKKLEILQSYANDAIVKDALKLTYDPFIRFYINKINKRKKDIPKPFVTVFNEHSFSEFKRLANALSERRITGNDAIAATHLFLDSCSDELRETFVLILKKDLKVGISVKTLQKAFGENFIENFTVQLANKYVTDKDYKVTHWFASPKLDGLRCYYTKGKLLTRNGHEIIGFDTIENELKSIVDKYKLDFVDGELYSTEINFQKIQGAVMSNKNIDPERKSKIKYNVFAVGNKKIKNTKDMVDLKDNIFCENYFDFLINVPYFYIENKPDTIQKFCEKFMSQGQEGVMLRHPDKWYEWKRSDALLKFKLFIEDDFKIIGFYEGESGTKLENSLGGIIIEGRYIDKEKNINVNVKSEVGSGFSDELRLEIWNNKSEYLGKTAEIKFQNITDDANENGIYSLRFPVFLKTKEDR